MKTIILIFIVITIISSDSCGGNCPSGLCPSCPCGTQKLIVDIPTWCAKKSWNQSCCKCIVSHESGGNSRATGYDSSSRAFNIGLFQINQVNWKGCNAGAPPCDTTQNLNCAWMIYGSAGNSWKPWSTHTACGC